MKTSTIATLCKYYRTVPATNPPGVFLHQGVYKDATKLSWIPQKGRGRGGAVQDNICSDLCDNLASHYRGE